MGTSLQWWRSPRCVVAGTGPSACSAEVPAVRRLLLLLAVTMLGGSCSSEEAVRTATDDITSTTASVLATTDASTISTTTSASVTIDPTSTTTTPPAEDEVESSSESGVLLRDRTFAGTDVTESGVRRQLVEGTELVLSFEWNDASHRDRLGWSAGCNRIAASVSVTDDRLHVDGDVTSSAAGCPDAHLAQEDWLTDFVLSGPHWGVEGGVLTLSSGDTTVTLQERASAPK